MSNETLEQPISQEQSTNLPLSEQEPIEKSRNEMVWKRERLKGLVEPPLLQACEDFYDKNIRTLSTSANKKDVSYGYAHMIVEVATMSPENVAIAQELAQDEGNEVVEYDGRQALVIHIPMDETTTASEIEEQSVEVASRFKKQPLTWSPVLTLSQLKANYDIEEAITEYDDSQVWVDEGFYYDEESDKFYLSEEIFRKIKEFE
jgi:hypothetical protein